jgi:hypothetical protein
MKKPTLFSMGIASLQRNSLKKLRRDRERQQITYQPVDGQDWHFEIVVGRDSLMQIQQN